MFHSLWRDECCDLPIKLRNDVFIEDADFHRGILVNLNYLKLMEISLASNTTKKSREDVKKPTLSLDLYLETNHIR